MCFKLAELLSGREKIFLLLVVVKYWCHFLLEMQSSLFLLGHVLFTGIWNGMCVRASPSDPQNGGFKTRHKFFDTPPVKKWVMFLPLDLVRSL